MGNRRLPRLRKPRNKLTKTTKGLQRTGVLGLRLLAESRLHRPRRSTWGRAPAISRGYGRREAASLRSWGGVPENDPALKAEAEAYLVYLDELDSACLNQLEKRSFAGAQHRKCLTNALR